MSIDSFISRMRQKEMALWGSTGKVVRPGEGSELNAETGKETPTEGSTIYEGACQIRGGRYVGRDVEIGERERRVNRLEVKFPADTPVKKDDVLTVLTCKNDVGMVGLEFRLTDITLDEWQVSRVAALEEVTT